MSTPDPRWLSASKGVRPLAQPPTHFLLIGLRYVQSKSGEMTYAELKKYLNELPEKDLERDVTVKMGDEYFLVFNFQIYMNDGVNIDDHSPFLFIQR